MRPEIGADELPVLRLADDDHLPIRFMAGLEGERADLIQVVSMGLVSTTLHSPVALSWTT